MGGVGLIIRVDGNREVGSGHVMRCCAIAQAAARHDVGVRFLVSDGESAAMLSEQGYGADVVGGDYRRLGPGDSLVLAEAAESAGARGIIVDSYAATDGFLEGLAAACHDRGRVVAYMDDNYRFESGYSPEPTRLPVDMIINYGFSADPSEYAATYAGTGTSLLIGPAFAPLRSGFGSSGYAVAAEVSSILVTTGSTNPDRTLERMASCCLEAVPDAEVHVVVGRSAGYDGPVNGRVVLHRNPHEMRGLMASADLVISAAGTTLYELASLGVPTIAAPIVENQAANIRGWARLGLGPYMSNVEWSNENLVSTLRDLARNRCEREGCSRKLGETCDGLGACRIVEAIVAGRS